MKLKRIIVMIVLCTVSGASLGAEFIYRDLMGDTLPTPGCSAKADALETTSKQYYIDKYAKRFCQLQGYGWGLEQVKNTGQSECEPCGNGQEGYQCRLRDVVVNCKRLKPGSVGLIPGKG